MSFSPVESLEVPLHKVNVSDAFWREYQRLVKDVVVPYQWKALNDEVADAEPSHAIENFRIAAGRVQHAAKSKPGCA